MFIVRGAGRVRHRVAGLGRYPLLHEAAGRVSTTEDTLAFVKSNSLVTLLSKTMVNVLAIAEYVFVVEVGPV